MKQGLATGLVFLVLMSLFAFAANDWRVPGVKPPAPPADWCAEHKVALSACEECNPKLARGGTEVMREREPKEGECPNTLVRIKLAPGVAAKTGLKLHTMKPESVEETLQGNAETSFVPTAYVRVAPRVPGVIREVSATLGRDVEAGAVLAILESADFGQAKADYLQALAVRDLRRQTHEQERELFEKKISTGRELLEAKTAYEEARLAVERAEQRLAALGLSVEEIQAVAAKKDTSTRFEVKSPLAGSVVEASAVAGEPAAPDRPLFAVADVSRMWISIDLSERALPLVERDQKVSFTVDGLPGQKFPGRVVAVSGAVDDRTRTVAVHADVKNVRGLLRARMFGRAMIAIKPAEPKLLVPKEALQDDGDCNLVFVSHAQDVYQARKIQLGAAFGNSFEVTGGLADGDRVVTVGSFLLKGEVLRGQMGAG